MRDVVAMANARQDSDWAHTASLMAQIANVGLRPKRPFRAVDFHPFRRERRQSIAESIRSLGPTRQDRYLPVSLRVTTPNPQEPAP